jgi:hypothetical protein
MRGCKATRFKSAQRIKNGLLFSSDGGSPTRESNSCFSSVILVSAFCYLVLIVCSPQSKYFAVFKAELSLVRGCVSN